MLSVPTFAESIVSDILALRECGPRSSHYRIAWLNRSPRSIRPIHRRVAAYAEVAGIDADPLWNDIKQLAELEALAD